METPLLEVKDELFVSDPEIQKKIHDDMLKGRKDKTLDARAIKTVYISGLAAIKMLKHAQQGVEDGIGATGVPVEVMGLLFGYPGDTLDTLIVQDAFPVPCKGGPHSAVMDPQTPVYMQDLGELLEQTRPHGAICGWYHSHPFEPLPEPDRHHCWFSDTDVSNQNTWQTMWESMAGRPFVGVVVDPQTSLQRHKLQMSAFRNFPPYHSNSTDCPDGRPLATETERKTRWGAAWRSYYEMQIRYFVASSSKDLLRYLTRDSEWISKICAGLIEEGVEGAPAAAAAGAGAGGRGCSKADLEREEALTNSVVQSLNSAAGLAFGTLMQVGGAMACLKPFLYCFPVAVTPALPVAAFQGAFGRRCFGNGPIPLEHDRQFCGLRDSRTRAG
eukprot:INCI10207.1.p1 GENE.INCI10207.1~~INCI10207.1.p1  ORF type:complete len:386 (+),score=55.39 INCI10207.1:229-1386(+)